MKIDKRLLRSTKYAKVDFYLSVFFGFAGGIFIVLQAKYLSKIVDSAFLKNKSLVELKQFLIFLAIVVAFRALMVWMSEGFASQMAAKVKYSLRKLLYDKIAQLGPSFTKTEQTGELINTAIQGIEDLDDYFSQYIPQLAITALIPITILFFVFPKDILSGFVMLLTAPIIPVLMILIGYLADKITKKQWKILSRMSAHFLDVLQGLTTLKFFGRSKKQIEIIFLFSERFRVATMKVLRIAFLSALVLELIASLSTAIIAVEIGLRLLYAKMEFENAFFVLILAPEFYLPFRQLGARFHAGMSGVAAAERIFQVLELESIEQEKKLNLKPENLEIEIVFDKVSYSYNGNEEILKDVSFTILQNQRVAIVGPTGAGKTSIVNLLLKFIQPTKGKILVGGYLLSTIDEDYWLKHVAWVPQNPYLFNGTILENIALAKPDASEEMIREAAKKAHVDEFALSLPEGYKTKIGERGTKLSGGQAQRIAIARAFLKDAKFIIFDEVTSNLDAKTEALITDSINRLIKNKTVLTIAHRLSTIMSSDKIIVLAKGQVKAIGNHEQLMKKSELYNKLVNKYSGRL